MWISLADLADNFLFFCWTDEEKRRKRDHSGMSCFIVERSMKGFSSGTIHGKLGIRAGNTGYFSLQDVRVPQENMVGEEGEGFKIAMLDRKSTRLNSSHSQISYAVFCLKKKRLLRTLGYC